MSSVQIENETFDLGYQFFDGLDYQTENFKETCLIMTICSILNMEL